MKTTISDRVPKKYKSPMSWWTFREKNNERPNIVELRDWIDFFANFCDQTEGCPLNGVAAANSEGVVEIWDDHLCPYYDAVKDSCFIEERTGSIPREWKVTGGNLLSDSRYDRCDDWGYSIELRDKHKKRADFWLTKTVMYKIRVTAVSECDAMLRAEAENEVDEVVEIRPWTIEDMHPDKNEEEK